MTSEAQTDAGAAAQARSGSRPAAGRPLQFSLAALMLAVLGAAVGSALVRSLGSVWFIPLMLTGLGAVNLILALCCGSSWRMLKPGYWHAVIWLGLGAASSGFAVRGCLQYNEIAGTDLTVEHMARVGAAVLSGPMVGPVANPGAGETPLARTWTAILFAILLAAAAPFLFGRRIASRAIALICWIGFIAATVLWYFGAMISLGFFLS